jgi:hypothetical protein
MAEINNITKFISMILIFVSNLKKSVQLEKGKKKAS